MSFKQYSEFQGPLNVFLGAGVSNSNNLITSSCTRAMFFIISTIFCPNLMMEIVKRVLVSVSSLDLKSWVRQVLHLSLRSSDQLWTACASYDGSAWIKTLLLCPITWVYLNWPLACKSLKRKFWISACNCLFASTLLGNLLQLIQLIN